MPPAHLLCRLSGLVAKHERDEIEEEQLRGLVQTPHWQYTGTRMQVPRHRLSRQMNHNISLAGRSTVGLRRHDQGARSRIPSNSHQSQDG